jgi:hypothetical protein
MGEKNTFTLKMLSWIGLGLIIMSLIALALSWVAYPRTFWNQGAEIQWYQAGVLAGETLLSYPYEPKAGEPQPEELVRIANNADSEFFTDVPSNEMILYDSKPGLQLNSALQKGGYKDFDVSRMMFDVVPNRPQVGIFLSLIGGATGIAVLGFGVVLGRRREPLRSKQKNPRGKMAKNGCPQCRAPVAVNDVSCWQCGAPLNN